MYISLSLMNHSVDFGPYKIGQTQTSKAATTKKANYQIYTNKQKKNIENILRMC